MKNLFQHLLFSLIAIAVFYLITAGITLELDPTQWPAIWRAFALFSMTFVCSFVWLAYMGKRHKERKQEELFRYNAPERKLDIEIPGQEPKPDYKILVDEAAQGQKVPEKKSRRNQNL